MRFSAFVRLTIAAAALAASSLATAAFPDKPIRIVIGFPAGGPLDQHARLLTDKLQAVLGQPILVDYKSGAGGTVGAQEVMKAAPDGYTLMLANTGVMVINPALYSKLPYSTLKDFTPVARTAMQPLALLVNPKVPASTLKEFIDYAGGSPLHAPLAYHWTRMIEMLHAAETIKDLLHDDDLSGSELTTSGARNREGVGVIEAPRGTLIHHYKVDEEGLMLDANLIIATGHNNLAMNRGVFQVAKHYVDGRKLNEGMLNRVEAVIRAFDPCLSCSTHALGKMKLSIQLYDCDGTKLDEVRRE